MGEYPELNRATMNRIPIPNIERIVAHATKRGLNFDEAAADLGILLLVLQQRQQRNPHRIGETSQHPNLRVSAFQELAHRLSR